MALSPTSSHGSGGGSQPAGSDGQIQFNDNDAFGASDNLAWDDVSTILTLAATPDVIASIVGGAPGVQVHITAADGDDGSHSTGGEVNIVSGSGGTGGNGGDVQLAAGAATDGDGGNVTIASGNSGDGDSGEIAIRAGTSTGGNGGQVVVAGGQGDGGGGDVILQGGLDDGNVQLYSGDGNQYVQLDNTNGLQIGATKLGFFQAASVAQPTGVAVTAEAIHAALVSLGLITA